MHNKLLSAVSIFTILCCIFLSSCGQDDECRTDRYVKLRAGFYRVDLENETATKLSPDSFTIQGIGIDSVLYKNVKNKADIELPLNKFQDVSSFSFKLNSTEDVVNIAYTRHEDYLSFECGILTTFTIDTLKSEFTTNSITSIVVNSLDVNTTNVENIKIYYRN